MGFSLLQFYALSMLGTPYRYGGNCVIHGLDCSGLVCEILRAAGELKAHEDLTAQQLYDRYENTGTGFQQGGLAFYGPSVLKVTHVAWVIDSEFMIEAGGGDSSTSTLDKANSQNAVVRIRPIKYRKDFLLTAMPAYTQLKLK